MPWGTIILGIIIWTFCIFWGTYLLHSILDIGSIKRKQKIDGDYVVIKIKKTEVQNIINNLNAMQLAMRNVDVE